MNKKLSMVLMRCLFFVFLDLQGILITACFRMWFHFHKLCFGNFLDFLGITNNFSIWSGFEFSEFSGGVQEIF